MRAKPSIYRDQVDHLEMDTGNKTDSYIFLSLREAKCGRVTLMIKPKDMHLLMESRCCK
jgi:hypothetical protein